MPKIIKDWTELLSYIILRPVSVFRKINNGKYKYEVIIMFLASISITLFKSFSKNSYQGNFFSNQSVNEIVAFFDIPQIRWVITLISFGLFVFLVSIFCKLFLKKCNPKILVMTLMSISGVGVILHLLFSLFSIFLSQNLIYAARHLAFIWIVCLSIAAIKNSQQTTFIKSIIIFILAGLPPIFIIGLPGIAPYSLWLI